MRSAKDPFHGPACRISPHASFKHQDREPGRPAKPRPTRCAGEALMRTKLPAKVNGFSTQREQDARVREGDFRHWFAVHSVAPAREFINSLAGASRTRVLHRLDSRLGHRYSPNTPRKVRLSRSF